MDTLPEATSILETMEKTKKEKSSKTKEPKGSTDDTRSAIVATDSARAMVTFVPQRTSTAKLSTKRPVESTKKLKKKLDKITDENATLAKLIDDKNIEIDDLKRSVQSLNEVLESVPIEELRSNSSIASNKIIELSKKNRQLRVELDAKKVVIGKRDIEIQKLERELKSLMDKLENDACEVQKDDGALKELQGKFSALQQKWFETRNKNVELQEKLKLAGKCLQQEIGDSFDLNKLNSMAAQNTCNWRGRAQQIIHLQQTINDLKARMEMLENMMPRSVIAACPCPSSDSLANSIHDEKDRRVKSARSLCSGSNSGGGGGGVGVSGSGLSFDRLSPNVRKTEILHRAKVEELEKAINELKAQLEEQRSKILALKVRNKTLNADMIKYKEKANSLASYTDYNGMNLTTLNEQLQQQRGEYESRIEQMSSEIKALKRQCDESEIREQELNAKLANAEETLGKRNACISEMEDVIKQLEQDMKAICGDFLFSCREFRKEEFIAILDSLETEKNYLLEQNKAITIRLNEERNKNENLSDQLAKQKIRNARLDGRVRDLEKEMESTGEKKKRLQRITDYANNLSVKSGSLSSFVFENSSKKSSTTTLCEEASQEFIELKNQLEIANEKIAILEERLVFLNEEKEKDAKAYEMALTKSKNVILETILSYRSEAGSFSNISCLTLDKHEVALASLDNPPALKPPGNSGEQWQVAEIA